MSTFTTSEPRTGTASRHNVGLGAVWGAAAALAVNITIWLIGRAGEPVRVITGWAPDGADLTVVEVVIVTVVAVGLGALLLVLMQRHRDRFRAWVIIATSVAIASAIPLWRLDVDTGSKVALTCMHLATGAAAVAGQAAARRRANIS
jgi:Family of unknown function (DUF6069)